MTQQTGSEHAYHDPTLVAAYASDDLTGTDLERARAITSACMACAALEADVRALAAATRGADLPMPPRRRDFRLTADDVARLHPTGWRRFVAAFASPRLSFTQPLAAGLTTLGVAGLLLAALPSIPLGMGGAAPAASPADQLEIQAEGEPRTLASEQVPMPSAASSAEPVEGFASPAGSATAASDAPGQDSGAAPSAAAAASPSGSAVPDDATARATPRPAGDEDNTTVIGAGQEGPPPNPFASVSTEPQSILIVLAGSMLIAGLGLFALRWLGGRLV